MQVTLHHLEDSHEEEWSSEYHVNLSFKSHVSEAWECVVMSFLNDDGYLSNSTKNRHYVEKHLMHQNIPRVGLTVSSDNNWYIC